MEQEWEHYSRNARARGFPIVIGYGNFEVLSERVEFPITYCSLDRADDDETYTYKADQTPHRR